MHSSWSYIHTGKCRCRGRTAVPRSAASCSRGRWWWTTPCLGVWSRKTTTSSSRPSPTESEAALRRRVRQVLMAKRPRRKRWVWWKHAEGLESVLACSFHVIIVCSQAKSSSPTSMRSNRFVWPAILQWPRCLLTAAVRASAEWATTLRHLPRGRKWNWKRSERCARHAATSTRWSDSFRRRPTSRVSTIRSSSRWSAATWSCARCGSSSACTSAATRRCCSKQWRHLPPSCSTSSKQTTLTQTNTQEDRRPKELWGGSSTGRQREECESREQ